jgi:hypothetical protein
MLSSLSPVRSSKVFLHSSPPQHQWQGGSEDEGLHGCLWEGTTRRPKYTPSATEEPYLKQTKREVVARIMSGIDCDGLWPWPEGERGKLGTVIRNAWNYVGMLKPLPGVRAKSWPPNLDPIPCAKATRLVKCSICPTRL